ncbi:hypothetical protein HOG48_03175 [Candidatus Peregrinibacteria bacterium]|jgi:hypothetical protein|nr:hypothetical protein [Candidatus Peregrinibacteria bacterium]
MGRKQKSKVNQKRRSRLVYALGCALIMFFVSLGVVFAASSVDVLVIARVLPAGVPLTPILIDVPETTYENYLSLDGYAENNVAIYMNDMYVTNADGNGDFTIGTMIQDGSNPLVLKAFRDEMYSAPGSYAVIGETPNRGGTFPSHIFDKPSPPISEIEDILEDEEVDEYVEGILDEEDFIVKSPSVPKGGSSSGETVVEEAIDYGIESTNEDVDRDGVSDFLEVVFGLDVNDKDTDNDGIYDVEEISDLQTYKDDGITVRINVKDGQIFTSNDLFVYGDIKGLEGDDYEFIDLCLLGVNGEQCEDLSVKEIGGDYHQEVNFAVEEGPYELRIKLGYTVIHSLNISFDFGNPLEGIIFATLDKKEIYKQVENRFVRKKMLFSFRSAPEIKGMGAGSDLVFLFWLTNSGDKVYRSLTLTDLNGIFSVKAYRPFSSLLGFKKVTVYAYGYDDGKMIGTDKCEFYVLDVLYYCLLALVITLFYRVMVLMRKRGDKSIKSA